MSRPRHVEARTMNADSVITGELPLDSQCLTSIDMLVRATPSDGGTDPSAAGSAYELVKRFRLYLNGKPICDLTGRQLFHQFAMQTGERAANAAPASGAGTDVIYCTLRHSCEEVGGREPLLAALNLAKYSTLRYEVEVGDIDDVYTAPGQWSFGSGAIKIDFYYNEVFGVVSPSQFVAIQRDYPYVMTGGDETKQWQAPNEYLRSLLIFGETSNALAACVTKVGLQVAGKRIIDYIPWSYLVGITCVDGGIDSGELATGVAYIDLIKGGHPLLDIGRAASIVEWRGTASSTIRFGRRTLMPVANFLNG